MRELSFAEVRAAGLPARVDLADVTYEYRPLLDGVAVRIAAAPQPDVGTTDRMPQTGWLHTRDCPCSYCQATE
jgi:hypothetical protein